MQSYGQKVLLGYIHRNEFARLDVGHMTFYKHPHNLCLGNATLEIGMKKLTESSLGFRV